MLLISVGCYFHVPRSKRFRNWLANIFYKTTGLVVKSADLKDAINIMSAQAEFDGFGDPIHPLI